jgi:putative DNA primase/helicase
MVNCALASSNGGLAAIAAALGGECYEGGRRASAPAPGHSKADRSVSLRLAGDRVLVHVFSGGDWREILDDLRGRGLIDDQNRLTGRGGGVWFGGGRGALADETLSDRARRAAARALWYSACAVDGTPSERHARLRAICGPLPGPEALRHRSDTPTSLYRPGRHSRPALLAAIIDPLDELVGVEVAFLAPNGAKATGLRAPRRTIGRLRPGSAVRLAPAARRMLVGEGVFTTLAAMERFKRPGWALLSTGNLRRWTPPAGVQDVLIAGDRGQDGERSAWLLRDRLVALGLKVRVCLPAAPDDDWNARAQRLASRPRPPAHGKL